MGLFARRRGGGLFSLVVERIKNFDFLVLIRRSFLSYQARMGGIREERLEY